MSIIVLQHTASEGPGRLGRIIRDNGKSLDIRRLDLPLGGPMSNRHIPRDLDGIEGVVTLGGPMNVGDSFDWMQPELEFLIAVHKQQLPLVGICLGAQMIAKALGGEVGPMECGPEWGMLPVSQHPIANTDIILAGVPWRSPMFHCHGNEVKKLPTGAATLQFSEKCRVQSYRVGLRTYGFQYHFELDLAQISGFLTCNDAQCVQSGIDPASALATARSAYAEYDRLSNRLCSNLASYLLPVTRAITA